MRSAPHRPIARSNAVRTPRRLQPGWARLIRAVHGRWTAYALGLAGLSRRDMTVKAVHDFRVASQRLAAALRLCSHATPGSAAGKLRRSVRRRFGRFRRLRDVQVMLRRLAPAAAEAAVIGRLQRRLAAEADRLRRGLLHKLDKGLPSAERAEMRAILAGLSAVARGAVRKRVTVLLDERLAAAQRRVMRRSARVAADDFAGLHRLRIAIKRARYLLELVAAAQDAQWAEAAHREARGWQDLLGLCQDLRVLDAELAAMRPKSPSDSAALARLRTQLAAELDRAVRTFFRRRAALDDFARRIRPPIRPGPALRRGTDATS